MEIRARLAWMTWFGWVTLHAVLTWLGLQWTYSESAVSIIAPAAGLGAVAVLMLRRRWRDLPVWQARVMAWSVAPVGAAAAGLLTGRSGWFLATFVMAFGLEALIAGQARLAMAPTARLVTPTDVLGLALIGLVAPMVPAAIITMGIAWTHNDVSAVEGLRWWVSHGLGMAAVAPILLTLRRDLWMPYGQVSWWERIGALVGLAGAATAVVIDGQALSIALAIFVSYWWAMRLGIGPAAWASGVIAAFLAFAASSTGGPFRGPLELVTTQLFAQGFVVMTMLTAVFSEGRRRAIHEARESAHRLEHVLNHDPVTGLPVRNVLQRELAARALRRPRQPLAMAVIDIDAFHLLNEQFGRSGGDIVLRTVARRLQRLTDDGALVHLNGDQFCIALIGHADRLRVDNLCDKVLSVVRSPIRVHGVSAQITASVGVAVGTVAEADRLLRDADDAVMAAKGQGRDRWVVRTQDQRAELAHRQALIDDLPAAVERSELFCDYQVITPVTHALSLGAEALVRWQHPRLGLLGPRDFLPTLIDAGRISMVGDVMLAAALAQWRAWQQKRDGHTRPEWVSVNISAVELNDPSLVSRVMAALERVDAPGDALVLEVTEECLIELSSETRNHIDQLRTQGVRLCIDDFGTGYSSLAYLTHLPIDVLKLDGAFVRGPLTPREHGLVHAVCSLGREIGVVTVIEGVETPEHVSAAIAAGADAIQGYLIGRPGPASALPTPVDLRRTVASGLAGGSRANL